MKDPEFTSFWSIFLSSFDPSSEKNWIPLPSIVSKGISPKKKKRMESQLVMRNIEDVQDWCILTCKKQESEELNRHFLEKNIEETRIIDDYVDNLS